MPDDGQLVVEVDDEAWAYRPATWALEAELAQRIGELAAGKAVLKPPGTARGQDTHPEPDQGAPGSSSRRRSRARRSPPRSRPGSPSSPPAPARARPPRSASWSPPPR